MSSAARTVRTVADKLEALARGAVGGEYAILTEAARELDDVRTDLAHAAAKIARTRADLDRAVAGGFAIGTDTSPALAARLTAALDLIADVADDPEADRYPDSVPAEHEHGDVTHEHADGMDDRTHDLEELTAEDVRATCDGCDATWPASSSDEERDHAGGCTDPESGAAEPFDLEADRAEAHGVPLSNLKTKHLAQQVAANATARR